MKYELSEDLKRHWFLCMKALTLRLLALDLLFLFGWVHGFGMAADTLFQSLALLSAHDFSGSGAALVR